MIHTVEDWECLERSEESFCNASAEAAQTLLDQHQFRPTIGKVRDGINSLLTKTFFRLNLQSKTSLDLQKVSDLHFVSRPCLIQQMTLLTERRSLQDRMGMTIKRSQNISRVDLLCILVCRLTQALPVIQLYHAH